ncbi:virulence-associated E family protein [Peribacillus frigoritolerans]|uniref:virulence-associated E family protein n=1 Tax=Peribacillus frigoritolerans TaxID=450367 RepID=UPI0024C177B7|nr:virulence-associated E family protein [Peribacillus frigoritolerans]WHX62345.1 virulence-associated E family protein [Peribacillus frigoritolerans]
MGTTQTELAAEIRLNKNSLPPLVKEKADPDQPKQVLEVESIDWKELLEVTRYGNYKSNVNNITLIFNNDENLKGKFAYNLLIKSPEIIGKTYWKRARDTHQITPNDEAALRNYFARNYGIQSKQAIEDVLMEMVLENMYHPVKDFLESVRDKWDGKPRIDTLLIDFFSAEDTELNRMQTRLTLIGAIKRIMQPGCKFDYVLTLKGDQGIGKSTFFQTLAVNPDWFSDSLEDTKGKDAKDQLKGNWFIELGEMAAVSKKDQKNIKQFIASMVDEYRPAYGKTKLSFARQNIFVASTNDSQPLKDDTGGRRWWIVECYSRWFDKDIKLDDYYIKQIWAEALSVYEYMESENIPLKLPDHLEAEAKKVQVENTDRGLLASEIELALEQGYYEKHTFEGSEKVYFNETCAKHVWEHILGRHKNDLDSTKAREINATLKMAKGWVPVGRIQFYPYGKQTVYRRKDR